MMIQISNNFSLDELTSSITAANLKIDNTPSQDAIINLIQLTVHVLQPLRNAYGKAIFVNSGYRCKKLNSIVGGATNSQHMTGEAADISAGNRAANKDLFNLVQKSGIQFDQLIDESNYQWIHVSFSKVKNRNQVLHL